MKGKKILAVFMTVFMMLSLLPSMVFAAAVPSGELGGKLKIKGAAAVGVTLSADYEKVTPEGVTDDYVSFKWSRKNGEELTELGTEKTYKVTEEDLGLEIVLEVTGAEAQGVTGKLTATTCPVAATEEEAEQHKMEQHADENETEEAPENGEEQPTEENVEEIPAPEENAEEIPAPEESTEGEVPSEEQLPEGTEENHIPQGEEEVFYPEGEQPSEEASPEEGTNSEENGEIATTEYKAEAVLTTEDGTGILDFGTLFYGYTEEELPEEQYVTIKNTGNVELNFANIAPESFMVQDVENPLKPGEEVTLWIIPRMGLTPWEYDDTLSYTTQEGAAGKPLQIVEYRK